MTAHESSVPEWQWMSERAEPSLPYLKKGLFRIATDIASGTRVLDIGCGNAAFTEIYNDLGCDIVGIDASSKGIEIARQRLPKGRFEVLEISGDILDLLQEEPFDFVSSTEVVEHLYAPHAWAQACYHCLKPGGKLFCSTPYHGYCKNLAISLAGGWDRHFHPLDDGGHIKFWSPATMRALLEKAGFQIRVVTGTGRMPGLWKSMIVLAERPCHSNQNTRV